MFGAVYCSVNNFISYLTVSCSVFTLLALTMDRRKVSAFLSLYFCFSEPSVHIAELRDNKFYWDNCFNFLLMGLTERKKIRRWPPCLRCSSMSYSEGEALNLWAFHKISQVSKLLGLAFKATHVLEAFFITRVTLHGMAWCPERTLILLCILVEVQPRYTNIKAMILIINKKFHPSPGHQFLIYLVESVIISREKLCSLPPGNSDPIRAEAVSPLHLGLHLLHLGAQVTSLKKVSECVTATEIPNKSLLDP